MTVDLQAISWTDRPGVACELAESLDSLDGPRRDRALRVLCRLASSAQLDALRREVARPGAPLFALDVFAALGGRLEAEVARAWLERDPGALGSVARALGASQSASCSVAGADVGMARRWWVQLRSAPPTTAAASLAGDLLDRWLPGADPTVAADRWLLELALPEPRAVERLVCAPVATWPEGLIALLWSDPPSVLDRVHVLVPSVWGELVDSVALPPRVLSSALGGRGPALAALARRLELIATREGAQARVLAWLHAGAVVEGRVRARVKGGYRITAGPVEAFCPASAGALEVGSSGAFEVRSVRRRSVVVSPAEGGRGVAATEEPIPEVPLAELTLRVASSWRPAAALLNEVLAGPAEDRAFRALRKVDPAAATAWALQHPPRTTVARVARIEARARDALEAHVEELADALSGPSPVRDAALRVLDGGVTVPRALLDALASMGASDRSRAVALRIQVRHGDAPMSALEALADDESERPLVRGLALRSLPEEALHLRAATWLEQGGRLARVAAEALEARGDRASMTIWLRACLEGRFEP